MEERVVAVTVTYNDYDYLKRALDALRKQTCPLQKIIVVDNHSNPEKQEKLKTQEDELVEVLWLSENTGYAGGLDHGMRYIQKEYSPEWYWIIDADAFPEPDCLEKLLSHKNDTRNIGALVPLVFGAERQCIQQYQHKKVSKLLYRDRPMFQTYKEIPDGISRLDAASFVGPLVSGKAVETLGVVDKGLFIYGDDVEYTYRISRQFDEFLIKDAIINHRDVSNTGDQVPTAWWKEYYAYRNWVLFIKKYKKNFLHGMICQGVFLLRAMKVCLNAVLSGYEPDLKKYRCALIIQAVRDGYAGRKGKTLDPVAERNKAKALEDIQKIKKTVGK